VGGDVMWVMALSGLPVLTGLAVLRYHPHCLTTGRWSSFTSMSPYLTKTSWMNSYWQFMI